MVTWLGMECVVKNTSVLIRQLTDRYRELRLYWVLCRYGAQATIPSSPADLLAKCASLVVDDERKERALSLLKDLRAARERQGSTVGRVLAIQEALDKACLSLDFHGDTLIEVRFSELVFESVWRMQTDELVDSELTPQGRLHIRIVLGRVTDFMDSRPVCVGSADTSEGFHRAPADTPSDDETETYESPASLAERDKILEQVLSRTVHVADEAKARR